ncbi:MAG: hypothetical protein ACJA0U_002542 [Salibacteraceae bacterium]|jgi:hypothetical protein
MKNLLLFSFLIVASFTYAQDLSDTIYYKSGKVRAGKIYQESRSAIKYEYLNNNNKIRKTFVRKIFLNAYTVGNEQNSIASNYTSPNPVSKEEREERKEDSKVESRNVGIFAGVLVIAITGVVVGIGILIFSAF